MSQKLSVKVTYCNDTRRFSLQKSSFQALQETVFKLFKFNSVSWGTVSIKYEDEEKDIITISSEIEFEEAVLLCKGSVLRLIIDNTKVGESPKSWKQLHKEALRLFDSTKKDDLERARQLLLQQSALTPSHPVTLYNLACVEARLRNIQQSLKFLEQAIACGYNNFDHIQQDTDLDSIRHVEEFHNIINRIARKMRDRKAMPCLYGVKWRYLEHNIQLLFESGSTDDLELARNQLIEQCSLQENWHSLYNLACVEALLKNGKQALDYLKKAIDVGYNDVDHIDRDTDLDFIRHTEEFKALQQLLRKSFKEDVSCHNRETKPFHYQDELKVLDEMGWTDSAENIKLLQQTNGDLGTTITILMSKTT